MFSFFKKKKVSVRSVTVPNFGWKLLRSEPGIIQWLHPDQTMAISVNFFNIPPDLPTMKNVKLLRNFYRHMVAGANGGLVQVDLIRINDMPMLKTIFKIPQGDEGVKYFASLTMAFETCSFVIKIETGPMPNNGMREALAADYLMKGGVDFDTLQQEWSADPYDKDFKEGLLMNKSEQEVIDALFPAHFLSQVRTLIAQVEMEMKWGDEVDKLKLFDN
jgi:hypothetical protein